MRFSERARDDDPDAWSSADILMWLGPAKSVSTLPRSERALPAAAVETACFLPFAPPHTPIWSNSKQHRDTVPILPILVSRIRQKKNTFFKKKKEKKVYILRRV